MDEIYAGYTSIEVGGATAGTQYRNTRQDDTGGFHDALWLGHSDRDALDKEQMDEVEIAIFKRDPDAYYALMGKGSPDQVEHAVQIAYENGQIGGKRPPDPLTEEDVEGFMRSHIGVDCIGYVMNVLITDEEFAHFGPESQNSDPNFTRVMNLDTKRFPQHTSALDDPHEWRTMDVVHWHKGSSGHVMMIYSCEQVSEDPAIFQIVTDESSSSQGPVRRTHFYRPDGGQDRWKGGTPGAFSSDRDVEDTWKGLGGTHIKEWCTVRRIPSGLPPEAASDGATA